MKSEWRTVALGSVADLTVGFVGTMASNYTETGIPFLRSTNIEPFDIKFDDIKYISSNFNESLRKSELHPNDVVIVRTGTPGACAVIPAGVKAWNCSDLVIVRPHRNKLNPLFLASYVNLASGVINTQLVGAVQQHYNVGAAKKMQIPLPPIGEQDKIASIIGMLNKKITINSKINDNLEQQAVALFKSWFVDFSLFGGTVPENWEDTTLENITTLIMRGIAPKYSDNSDQTVINQKCIRNHTIDLSLARTHTPKTINEKWLQFGDLLINSTGDGTLGRVAQVWFAPKNLTVDSHVTIVRPAREELIFYIGLWGILHEKEIESLHTGSTGQTELPRDRVKMLKLLLPDDASLSRFNSIIAPIASTIISNQEENQKLANLRNILLPKLMSGEIDVSNIQL